MTQRLVIKAGGGSPLRFAAAGVDAGAAAFSDLLFDANQAPLRVMQQGAADIRILSPNEFTVPWLGSNDIPLAVPPPAGKYNMFEVLRETVAGFPDGVARGCTKTPSQAAGNAFGSGFGGMSRDTVFNCISWAHDATGNNGAVVNRVYYLIFRNYW
nr:MAG TPA: hypothetical protein [Caudoviricetes sp.]